MYAVFFEIQNSRLLNAPSIISLLEDNLQLLLRPCHRVDSILFCLQLFEWRLKDTEQVW